MIDLNGVVKTAAEVALRRLDGHARNARGSDMDYQTLFGGTDKQVRPRGINRRGTFIVPVEPKWIIKRDAADATSGSLRRLPKRSPPFFPARGGAYNLPPRVRGRLGRG